MNLYSTSQRKHVLFQISTKRMTRCLLGQVVVRGCLIWQPNKRTPSQLTGADLLTRPCPPIQVSNRKAALYSTLDHSEELCEASNSISVNTAGLINSQWFSLGGRITRDFRFQTYFSIFQIFYNGRNSFYYLQKRKKPCKTLLKK